MITVVKSTQSREEVERAVGGEGGGHHLSSQEIDRREGKGIWMSGGRAFQAEGTVRGLVREAQCGRRGSGGKGRVCRAF